MRQTVTRDGIKQIMSCFANIGMEEDTFNRMDAYRCLSYIRCLNLKERMSHALRSDEDDCNTVGMGFILGNSLCLHKLILLFSKTAL